MASINLNNLSPLAQSALSLDADFAELQRLGEQMERLSIESESGMSHAREALSKFGEVGLRVAEGVQTLAKCLEEARGRAEKSADLISQRAAVVQRRQEESNRLLAKFQALSAQVHELTAATAQLKSATASQDHDKALLQQRLSILDSRLGTLVEEMRHLQGEARGGNFKTLEKNADAFAQSMLSARRKLNALAEQAEPSTHA